MLDLTRLATDAVRTITSLLRLVVQIILICSTRVLAVNGLINHLLTGTFQYIQDRCALESFNKANPEKSG